MTKPKPAWVDCSSYRQGDELRGGDHATSWVIQVRRVAVVVHRLHLMGGWFVSCHEISVNKRPLAAESHEDAKREAMHLVRCHLRDLVEDMDGLLRAMKIPPGKKRTA